MHAQDKMIESLILEMKTICSFRWNNNINYICHFSMKNVTWVSFIFIIISQENKNVQSWMVPEFHFRKSGQHELHTTPKQEINFTKILKMDCWTPHNSFRAVIKIKINKFIFLLNSTYRKSTAISEMHTECCRQSISWRTVYVLSLCISTW